MSPVPFQSHTSGATTQSITPLPALNRKINKLEVEGAKLPTTEFKEKRVTDNSFVENDVKEHDRPANLRTVFMSPIPFNPTTQTASPALNKKRTKLEEEEILRSSKNGITKQGVLHTSVAVENVNGYDRNLTLRSLNSSTPFRGHITSTQILNKNMNNQEDDGVTDTLPSIEDIIEKNSLAQKTELSLKLFKHLPENVVEGVLAQKLSTMPIKQLGSMLNGLPEEV